MASKEYETAKELMGTKVIVFKEMERAEDEKQLVYWKPVPKEPFVIGTVTGIRWKQIGYYHSGGPGPTTMNFDLTDEGYEEPSFEQKRTVPILLVVVKPQHNPLFVPFNGFRTAHTTIPERIQELMEHLRLCLRERDLIQREMLELKDRYEQLIIEQVATVLSTKGDFQNEVE